MATNSLSFAQKETVKFGKVSDEEMNMTVYDKDTSAPAVVLYDYGIMDINYNPSMGFVLETTVHKRIKILTKDGLDYANSTISLYDAKTGDDEVLINFKGQTYNIEGGKQIISKITKKEVFSEQASETRILKKFALTNVKVGSIIEYEYMVRSPFFWSIDPWYFQDEIPCAWSELKIKIPEYLSFKNIFGGYISPSINESNSENKFLPDLKLNYSIETKRWVFKDVPSFKDEKFITTPIDYMSKVEFDLQSTQFPGAMFKNYSTSWHQIGKELMEDENFGKAIDKHGMVKELTEKINSKDSVYFKIETACALIMQTMKWDESLGIFIDKNLKSVSTKKQGNMAEINLLLVNLLRSVGIEAYPVLISTRNHGKINQVYPRLSSFNTVVALAKVKGKNMLIDATKPFLKPGQLTLNSINGEGLLVAKDKIEWIPLLSTEQYSSTSVVAIEIKNEQIFAKMSRATKSMEAMYKRQSIASEGKEKFIENYKKKNNNWEIGDYTIENEINSNDPLIEKITINNFNNIDISGDIIYLPSVLVDEVQENPFSSETREYPVDFAVPRFEKYILSIAIPEGYDVDELPKGVSVTLPENAASFTYQTQKNQTNIQVVCQLKINKTTYLSDEYAHLKELYKNIIAKYGEQIVLKKKI